MVNPSGGGVEIAAGTEDDEAICKDFNYSKFSNLADRIFGEGDIEALKMLERFKARWMEKYRLRSRGSSSATVGLSWKSHPPQYVLRAMEFSLRPLGLRLLEETVFPSLETFVKSARPVMRDVVASHNGFYFFIFKIVAAMDEVLPVCVKLRNLPVEYWTDEGLTIVESGTGRPLYQGAITRACARINYARSLGHEAKQCPLKRKEEAGSKPVQIYVPRPKGLEEPSVGVHKPALHEPREANGHGGPREKGLFLGCTADGRELHDSVQISQEVVGFYQSLLKGTKDRSAVHLDFMANPLTGD
ncbi:hypothetical protein Salat_1094100 [Sesamum alatum]|uniref:Uncharacterized protein n=1 Tax=Sesamum alatum TaxID=300844 RepID=A0AAE1YPE8_9LAMI|nr:hypothetical protein Salat_1094100 [Sesamum alatum]